MEETIEGRRAVFEALRAGRPIRRLLVIRGARGVDDLVGSARRSGVPVQVVERAALDRASATGHHQGVIAVAAVRAYAPLEALFDLAASRGEPPFVVVLDGIEDPQNLGSIVRATDAVGAHGVVVPARRAAGLTAAVARASAGALEHVLVARVSNVVRALEEMKARGLWVVGADRDGSSVYEAPPIAPPVALVIGGEGKGLSRLVRERCDRLVALPMRGAVASLNAAAAAAVLLYEILRHASAEGR